MKPATLAAALLMVASPALAADPLEPVNRQVHAVNTLLRAYVLGPAAELYLAHAPAPLRTGVANTVANLAEPVTAASALLAGDTAIASNAAVRFAINSTWGLAGWHDAAADWGFPRQPMAVADALCRWGLPAGPFLVLPLLGPTTLRDAGGTVLTSLALSHTLGTDAVLAWGATAGLLDYTALHPHLARAEAMALDPYAVQRSLYQQRRAMTCAVDGDEEE